MMEVGAPEPKHAERVRAAMMLADEMRSKLHVEVNRIDLLQWIQDRWHIISPLAHTIHGKPDDKTPEPEFFNEVELGDVRNV